MDVDIDRVTSGTFWYNKDFDFDWSESDGRSGGLLTIWNPSIFQKLDVLRDDGFLINKGKRIGYDQRCYIGNVYGLQDESSKKLLWNKLSNLVNAVLDPYG